MSEITLEAIEAKQTELVALIAKFKSKAPRILKIDGIEIELAAGEHYAGAVLEEDATVLHHLVLMAAKPDDTMEWQEAINWAVTVGGALPTRQEAALLYANCKPHIDAVWHWTSERHETNASYAWFCDFLNGYQYYNDTSASGAARAVRRLTR